MDNNLRSTLSTLHSHHLIDMIDLMVQHSSHADPSEMLGIIHKKLTDLSTGKSWLFGVPSDILIHVLTEWLTLKDFAALDTAITNKSMRRRYWHFLTENLVCITSVKKYLKSSNAVDILRWLSNRHLKIDSIDASVLLKSGHLRSCTDLSYHYDPFMSKCIKKVDFSQCAFMHDDMITEIMQRCCQLDTIILSGCLNLTHRSLVSILVTPSRSKLKVLDVSNCVRILDGLTKGELDSTAAATTTIHSNSLVSLHLHRLSALEDRTLQAIILSCVHGCADKARGFMRLDIGYCTSLSRSTVLSILCCYSDLVELNVSGLLAVDDSAAIGAARTMAKLVRLSVADCLNVGDDGMLGFIQNCPCLEYLDMSNNSSLTDNVLINIPLKCQHLHSLVINACTNFSVPGVMTIIKSCAVLSILEINGYDATFDQHVRQAILYGKHWLGSWQDRRLHIQQSTV